MVLRLYRSILCSGDVMMMSCLLRCIHSEIIISLIHLLLQYRSRSVDWVLLQVWMGVAISTYSQGLVYLLDLCFCRGERVFRYVRDIMEVEKG